MRAEAEYLRQMGLLTPRGSRRTAWRLFAAFHLYSPTRVFVAAPARDRRRHRPTAGAREPALTGDKRLVTPSHGRCGAGVREAIQDRIDARPQSVSGGGQEL